jgi:Spy/CpxP family protein refolding chaperone
MHALNLDSTTPATKRRAWHGLLTLITAILLVAGLTLALPVHAKGGRDHHGRGEHSGWIERHAEELGIDDATLAQIERIIDASRESAEAIYDEHRAARDAMRALLDADAPDRAAVMAQAEVIGEIDVRKHQYRLATMLEIRALLTPEQRTQLRAIKSEMHERRGDHHKRKRRGRPGQGDGDAADAPDEGL